MRPCQAARLRSSTVLSQIVTWFQLAGMRDARLRSPDTLASFVWASQLKAKSDPAEAAQRRRRTFPTTQPSLGFVWASQRAGEV